MASAGSLRRTCQSNLAQLCKHMTDSGSLLLWVGGAVSFAGYAVRGGKGLDSGLLPVDVRVAVRHLRIPQGALIVRSTRVALMARRQIEICLEPAMRSSTP